MTTNDGGPAFPAMSLRDYFAAQVAPGIIVAEMMPFLLDFKGESELEGSTWSNCAEYAYRMADALLAERAKEQK